MERQKINKFTRKQFFGNSQQFSSFLKMVCTVYVQGTECRFVHDRHISRHYSNSLSKKGGLGALKKGGE